MRKLFYLLVAVHFSVANAGAYDDFFVAVIRDDPGAIQSLLAEGFDANAVDPTGQPAAILAIQRDSGRAFDALVAAPALDVNLINQAGESALMLAAIKGQLEWCERLLQRGAKVNQPGWSPLHYAASGPNPRIVELLLGRGAALEARSPNGSTPLMMAARYGSEETVKILLDRGASPTARNERDLSAVEFAQLAGREKLAGQLQQIGR